MKLTCHKCLKEMYAIQRHENVTPQESYLSHIIDLYEERLVRLMKFLSRDQILDVYDQYNNTEEDLRKDPQGIINWYAHYLLDLYIKANGEEDKVKMEEIEKEALKILHEIYFEDEIFKIDCIEWLYRDQIILNRDRVSLGLEPLPLKKKV